MYLQGSDQKCTCSVLIGSARAVYTASTLSGCLSILKLMSVWTANFHNLDFC